MSEQFLSDSQLKVNDRNSAIRLRYSAPQHAMLESVDLKELSENEVLVQSLFSGISRGTERLVFTGKVPLSEWARMRCPHQSGEFSFPVTYGYASVGKVISTGSNVQNTQIGDQVFVLHPHQNLFIVEESWLNLLPANMSSPEVAVLSANLETALNANWDGDVEDAKSIAVIGGGVVGFLTAFIAKKISGKIPWIIDIDPKKEILARKFGINFCLADNIASESHEKFECIFHTSASEQGLQLAIEIAEFEGRIIEMSWYGDKSLSLNLGGAFHSQRLALISSQVGHVATKKRATHTHAKRMEIAMEHLSDPILKELLNPVISFSELPQKLEEIMSSNETLCPLITYPLTLD